MAMVNGRPSMIIAAAWLEAAPVEQAGEPVGGWPAARSLHDPQLARDALPVSVASTFSRSISRLVGRLVSAPIAWSTPMARPLNITGKHTAEQARRSCSGELRADVEHAAALVDHPSGRAGSPRSSSASRPGSRGAPRVGLTWARRRWAWLASTSSSSALLSGMTRSMARGDRREHLLLVVGDLERLRAGRCGTSGARCSRGGSARRSVSCVVSSWIFWAIGRNRNPTTNTMMPTPSSSSVRAHRALVLDDVVAWSA